MELYNQARTSFDIFRSLFCNRDEFKSQEAGEQFLADRVQSGEKALLESMMVWTKSLMRALREEELVAKRSSNEYTEIAAELAPFITTPTRYSSNPCPWPIIKLVRYFLRISFTSISNLP